MSKEGSEAQSGSQVLDQAVRERVERQKGVQEAGRLVRMHLLQGGGYC